MTAELRVFAATEQSGAPIVRFSKVIKRFGNSVVLDSLDLEVRRGEKVAIIGPSGSGKTTVLRTLMTLESIDDGEIFVEEEPLTHMRRGPKLVAADKKHLRRLRGKIGMCFQQFNLFPHMSALENCVEAPIRVLGMSKQDARERCVELLEMVGLKDKIAAHPAQLSGGQQQRVAIARALAMRPKVLLFDEVTSALDPEVIGEVTSVIKKVMHEHSLTIVMVTHQMSFAREVSDRVCFFCDGRIVEQGTPQQVLDNPRHERTRKFLNTVMVGR